ncbi:MAG: TIGR02710 family CRISPR-associated CARF protein [Pseudanabaenaceae cyanobacterium SKYGB_i_bin29]|nr:TIGR02710 family CRISPR-associated CARF protein [Pseudanabaenaceae cyanobacterium SKYG29]MDW8420651.1 TIGR02710 family CRISPR-associated CARF protein [Pseudanabaenaceae cyanobacterium SKYGB_i_bin29]
MTKVLFVTVGGSPQPIVTAIKSLNPDRVIFICSSNNKGKGSIDQVVGKGTPCEIRKGDTVVDRLPNIPTQAEITARFNPDRDIILIDDPDDLSECYTKIADGIKKVKEEEEMANIYADYTGSTKTMSAALVVASLDYDIQLMITTSTVRTNNIRVEVGERTRRARTIGMSVRRLLEQNVTTYLKEYNYSAAVRYLEELQVNHELVEQDGQKVGMCLDICRAFDAWDKFEHSTAWQLIQPYMKSLKEYGIFLKKVKYSRNLLDPDFRGDDLIKGHGYEVLQDLLLNVERRVEQKRYDDAVGRLYRSLELLAQLRLLLQYGLKTENVDVTQLPKDLQSKYESYRLQDGKVQLALQRSYELLCDLNDPLGRVYENYKGRIMDALATRNYSILAHGFSPIIEEKYRKFADCILGFMREGLSICVGNKLQEAPQFISDLSLLTEL